VRLAHKDQRGGIVSPGEHVEPIPCPIELAQLGPGELGPRAFEVVSVPEEYVAGALERLRRGHDGEHTALPGRMSGYASTRHLGEEEVAVIETNAFPAQQQHAAQRWKDECSDHH
jgi:hypothetical protein